MTSSIHTAVPANAKQKLDQFERALEEVGEDTKVLTRTYCATVPLHYFQVALQQILELVVMVQSDEVEKRTGVHQAEALGLYLEVIVETFEVMSAYSPKMMKALLLTIMVNNPEIPFLIEKLPTVKVATML